MAKKSYLPTKKEENCYCELFEEVMSLWRQYSKEYRTIRDDYSALYAEKIKLKINRGKGRGTRVEKWLLKEFPSIKFLSIADEKLAEEHLYKRTDNGLKRIRSQIKQYIDSQVRSSLLDHIYTYRYLIRQARQSSEKKKWQFRFGGVDPNSCSGSFRRSGTHTGGYKDTYYYNDSI